MAVRKTVQWMFVIGLLVAVVASGFGYWLLTRSDELLRRAVAEKVAEILPGWNVEVGRARFDWDRQVYLWNSTLKTGDEGAPLVQIPEISLTVDGQALSQNQQVVVQRVRISNAQVELVRDPLGRWNWQDLPKLPPSNMALPEFEILRANVRVRLEHADGPPTILHVTDADFRLVPSGKRRFIVQGLTQVDRAGRLTIREGRWNLDEGTWSIQGEMLGVQAGADLLELIATASPELRQKLASLDQTLQSFDPGSPPEGRSRQFVQTAENETNGDGWYAQHVSHAAATSGELQNLGVQAALDIQFRVTRWQRDAEPEFVSRVEVRQGTITNPALPFPLRDVTGVVRWDNRQIKVEGLLANHGATRFQVDGDVTRLGEETPAEFVVTVEQLPLDERLRGRLTESARRLYDAIQPSGRIDAAAKLLHDGKGHWKYRDLVITTKDSRCKLAKFPYPVHGVSGSITQQGEELVIDFRGLAGRSPWTAHGKAANPGPAASVDLTVTSPALPIDDALRAAFEPHPAIQRTAELLDLKGRVKQVEVRLVRPPGVGQKFQPYIVANLEGCTVNYEQFPYRLTQLSGELTYRPDQKTCTFSNLTAKHDTATLFGHGYFTKQQEPGLLWLAIDADDAQLDKSLERALPDSLQTVWHELSPAGRINRLTANIEWRPGSLPKVSLPNVEVADAKLVMRSLPYPINGISAKFAYRPPADPRHPAVVSIESFDGWHEATHVTAPGSSVEVLPDGRWRLLVKKFRADDLVPDQRFRRALPVALRNVCEELNPRGPLSLGGWFDLRGAGLDDGQLQASWDVKAVLSNGKLTAGLELENVYGSVSSDGTWDGEHVVTQGYVDLDSVYVWEYYQLTNVKGPYRLIDTRLIVGADTAQRAAGQGNSAVPESAHLTADFVRGKVLLDADATLDESISYTVKTQISEGRLEEFARLYMSGTPNLRGIMNGWLIVKQQGSQPLHGRGELLISPAAIYELPVMAQVYKALNSFLNSAQPDNTAFNYAYLKYQMDDEKFLFDRIDLVGDALSLRGSGAARFDSQLNLGFYSRLPRSRLLPQYVSNLLGDATQGWMEVRVTGRTDAPNANYRAVPVLSDSLNRLLKAFDPNQPGPMPLLRVPQFFPSPSQWGVRPAPPTARQ